MPKIDPSLPSSIEFSEIHLSSTDAFIEIMRGGYETAYHAGPSSSEEPKINLILPNRKELTIYFSPEAEVAIKKFHLFYNPQHVIHYDSPPCKSSENRRHVWQEILNIGKLVQIKCLSCGYSRFLVDDDVKNRLSK